MDAVDDKTLKNIGDKVRKTVSFQFLLTFDTLSAGGC